MFWNNMSNTIQIGSVRAFMNDVRHNSDGYHYTVELEVVLVSFRTCCVF